jgi:hypothetical protein
VILVPRALGITETEGARVILGEEVENRIYVQGVIVDGDRGVLLAGRDDSALIIES